MSECDEADVAVQAVCVAAGSALSLLFASLAFGPPSLRARVLGGTGDMHWDNLRAEHVTGSSRGWTPCRLGVLRLAFGIFIFFSFSFLGRVELFGTFTIWSWTLLGFYFCLAGLMSICKGVSGPDATASDNRASKLHCFVWVLFQVMTTCAPFICIVVWVVLIPLDYAAKGQDRVIRGYFNFVSFNAHNTNVAFVLIEMYLNRMTLLRAHAPFICCYGAMYIIFSWFQYWQWDRFFYIFVNWNCLGYGIALCYWALAGVLYCVFIMTTRCSAAFKRGIDPATLPSSEEAQADEGNELPLAKS